MAQKVQVILVDDIDGGAADETVTFALDGVSYEIDLSTKNAQQLRDAFASWVGNARKVSSRTSARPAARRGRSTGSARATEIREWARANGHKVNDRGRISQEIQAAYDAAH
ncbi:Lsr2 family protein [Cellulosimicrobium sp. Marseille-Q4280]|uniref:histone-like nucleoid-structuring protein Lsr2 n=1 Tax=Cellulosimicrobium sp. Marseille-Q4280 TaxID=2937992 RepID=UPI00203BD044|nr:Lsr2 family protein [Cellulosimicrobium sp. Marseille-Q4280]